MPVVAITAMLCFNLPGEWLVGSNKLDAIVRTLFDGEILSRAAFVLNHPSAVIIELKDPLS